MGCFHFQSFYKYLIAIWLSITFFILILCTQTSSTIATDSTPSTTFQKIITQPIDDSTLEKVMKDTGLLDIKLVIPAVITDIRYSTENNFMKTDVYGDYDKCYLQKEAAEMLKQADLYLKESHPSYDFYIYDCTRPWKVQFKMWDIVKGTDGEKYVAYPKSGSMHNYGAAIDLSLADENGKELDMGTPYDFFGEQAHIRNEEVLAVNGVLSDTQLEHRLLLRSVMRKAGFHTISNEWWHFNAFSNQETKEKYEIVDY